MAIKLNFIYAETESLAVRSERLLLTITADLRL